jgi:hypothetical protein
MSNLIAIEKKQTAIRGFLRDLDDYPGWREWQRKRLSFVLAAESQDIIYSDDETLEEFRFSTDIERQHNVIMLYLNLSRALVSLKDVEYYFRRYPFHGLPVIPMPTERDSLTND